MTRLKRLRQEKKISGAELARRLRISRASVCIAEKKGLRNVAAAHRYATVLGCDWRDLLEDPAAAAGTVMKPHL